MVMTHPTMAAAGPAIRIHGQASRHQGLLFFVSLMLCLVIARHYRRWAYAISVEDGNSWPRYPRLHPPDQTPPSVSARYHTAQVRIQPPEPAPPRERAGLLSPRRPTGARDGRPAS